MATNRGHGSKTPPLGRGFSLLIIAFLGLPYALVAAPIADAQRNAAQSVLGAGEILCADAARFAHAPYMRFDQLQQKFEVLREQYANFKANLAPEQFAYAMDQLADLDDGLDIIQQLFTNQEQLAVFGRSDDLKASHILKEAVHLWCRKFQFETKVRMQIG